ncbi:DUF2628 domain-containing protein [Acidisoma sp. C75]
MRIYSAHTRPGRAPLLVPEGFSWGAFLFGPFWLMAHRAWIAALLALVVLIGFWIVAAAVSAGLGAALLIGYALMLGAQGRDLRRWSLSRRGFAEAGVVAAPDADAAFLRACAVTPGMLAEERA